jgi:aminoglycoside phosphotransferase (APT) family kinase protein
VYPALSAAQKRALAARIVGIQACVGEALPEGRGFGYVLDPEAPFPFASWPELVRAALARSRKRIARAGIVTGDPVSEVERAAARVADHLAAVRPRPFLDDTTTKNVIVERGALSGIVDVDVVCYGDPLFPLALTRCALRNEGFALDYADAWADALALDAAQVRALRFYTALFCTDLLGEYGARFNRAEPLAVDPVRIERLRAGLSAELAPLG